MIFDMSKAEWQQCVLNKYYYGKQGWKDGTTQFLDMVSKAVGSSSDILEIGAGPTNKKTAFLATFGRVTGLDVDPVVKTNEYCHEAFVYDGIHMPFNDGSFDIAIADFVLEHVEHPAKLASEIYRVLRPEGRFIFRTPNLWHYVSLAAKITPHWFHNCVANRMRTLPDGTHEPYPTYHRMNTKRACIRTLTEAGFSIEKVAMIEPEPSYGLASPVLFYPLMAWERLLNSSSLFEIFRVNILCVAKANKKVSV